MGMYVGMREEFRKTSSRGGRPSLWIQTIVIYFILMLVVDNLRKYIDRKLVFGPVSFKLEAGQVVFIKGPSGAGKTLMLRLISCLDIPIDKNLPVMMLDGKNPYQCGLEQWRRQVMYVPQGRVAMQGTPSEFWGTVVSYKTNIGRETLDLKELVTTVGLERSVLDSQWSELSGGQAQRVALSIAVALTPSVLLLDEPTSALDHSAALLVEEMLKKSGCALLWVSHTEHQAERVGGRILQLTSQINTEV
jgi:ABC-type iron transport system FetAB ATPase subunit